MASDRGLAGPARAHLVKLKAAEWVSAASTTHRSQPRRADRSAVRPARESAHDRIRPATAAAILALNLDLAAPAAKAIVDGAGTARRIRALCCIGWSLTAQAAQVGWTVQNYSPLKDGGPDTANTARLIADLHSQLCMTSAVETAGAGVQHQAGHDGRFAIDAYRV
ncbi:hypothetical protein ACFQS1_21495 [Paractinoplanes rhizophilus]|uniref:Uncharacterized protein n=1 Tax=Paractinoplanes rhizophilus TaxID=1416877 RepID=A0ABW2HUR8_9ACTN